VSVRLLSGTAERDGTELALNHNYSFARTKSKILTYTGCSLEVSGEVEDYVAQCAAPEDSPMLSYLNLHFTLQTQRRSSSGGRGRGPRVMICGPHNTGKTTLARTLAALATRMGEQPLVANVDPREGLLSLPGTVSAAVFGTIMDVEEPTGGFGVSSTPCSGPSLVPVKLPMVYYYGREKVEEDMPLWKDLVTKLASSVRAKLSSDDAVRSGGLVLDTPAVTAVKGEVEILLHAVREFAGMSLKAVCFVMDAG
jgi:polyribonucleotide 5'-hydroxyl-kinase